MRVEDTVKGVFLLILAVAGNFVAETLGCKTQKLLTENMIAKHSIIILILYFAIGFVSNDDPQHPVEVMKTAIFIYILFLLFTKMNLFFTILVFIILAITYINSTFIEYYKTQKTNKSQIEQLEKIQNGMYITLIVLIVTGFSLYFKKQYGDYYKNWSTVKFIFGVNKCKSMI